MRALELAACRPWLQQPFSAASIWNTPLGAGAVLEPPRLFPAALGGPERCTDDTESRRGPGGPPQLAVGTCCRGATPPCP